MIFEILSQFIEKECNPESVIWEHKLPDGKDVRQEMQDLYDWWHQDYLVNFDCFFEEWHTFKQTHCKDAWLPVDNECKLACLAAGGPDEEYFEWVHVWDTLENERTGEKLFDQCRATEVDYTEQLTVNMKRVIDITPYMWT